MSTPVKTFGEYVVCFDAEDEELPARYHFINECCLTEKEFKRIKPYAWFCARVSIWKDGKELATDYLGCCSYKTEAAFYKQYEGDYFADMVRECARQIGESALLASVEAWHAKLRQN